MHTTVRLVAILRGIAEQIPPVDPKNPHHFLVLSNLGPTPEKIASMGPDFRLDEKHHPSYMLGIRINKHLFYLHEKLLDEDTPIQQVIDQAVDDYKVNQREWVPQLWIPYKNKAA